MNFPGCEHIKSTPSHSGLSGALPAKGSGGVRGPVDTAAQSLTKSSEPNTTAGRWRWTGKLFRSCDVIFKMEALLDTACLCYFLEVKGFCWMLMC